MGSRMLNQLITKDIRFDHPFKSICAYDGCRINMRYTNPNKLQVLNDNRYCSKSCLDKQYQGLGIDGAIHLVHQTFGPNHPVTKQIQKLRYQHRINNKFIDAENRRIIGKDWEDKNFARLCHMTEKCL